MFDTNIDIIPRNALISHRSVGIPKNPCLTSQLFLDYLNFDLSVGKKQSGSRV